MEIGQIPEEVNAGDRLQIPIQLVNVGRGMVYNARCTVDVPGLQTDKSLFLGNIEEEPLFRVNWTLSQVW